LLYSKLDSGIANRIESYEIAVSEFQSIQVDAARTNNSEIINKRNIYCSNYHSCAGSYSVLRVHWKAKLPSLLPLFAAFISGIVCV